jgi:hypothetical protein
VDPGAAETFWQRFITTYRFAETLAASAGGTHFGAPSGQLGAMDLDKDSQG